MFLMTTKTAINELCLMKSWTVMLGEQFNALLYVVRVVTRKELSFFLTLRMSLFGMFSLSFHYYKRYYDITQSQLLSNYPPTIKLKH
jgi:hypothetical protein